MVSDKRTFLLSTVSQECRVILDSTTIGHSTPKECAAVAVSDAG